MNQISIRCADNSALKITGRLEINQFSSNTTELVVNFPNFTKDHSKYMDTITPDGVKNQTAINLVGGDTKEIYPLPYELLSQHGRLQLQFVTKHGDNTVYESDRFSIAVNKTIGATDALVIEYKDTIQTLVDNFIETNAKVDTFDARIDAEIINRNNAIATEVMNINTAMTSETFDRIVADNMEIAIRQAADEQLQSNMNTETNTRIANDNIIQENIESEIIARQNAMNTHKDMSTLDHPDGSVTNAKLAVNAVTTVKIEDRAVTANKIEVNSVTTPKIANDAVTDDKIGTRNIGGTVFTLSNCLSFLRSSIDTLFTNINVVTTAINTHFNASTLPHPDGSVTNIKIADGAVTNTKILANAVGFPQLNTNVISKLDTNPDLDIINQSGRYVFNNFMGDECTLIHCEAFHGGMQFLFDGYGVKMRVRRADMGYNYGVWNDITTSQTMIDYILSQKNILGGILGLDITGVANVAQLPKGCDRVLSTTTITNPKWAGSAITVDATANTLNVTGLTGVANGDRVALVPTTDDLTGVPTGLLPAWSYFVVGLVGTTFGLSLTSGGAAIDITTVGDGTKWRLEKLTHTGITISNIPATKLKVRIDGGLASYTGYTDPYIALSAIDNVGTKWYTGGNTAVQTIELKLIQGGASGGLVCVSSEFEIIKNGKGCLRCTGHSFCIVAAAGVLRGNAGFGNPINFISHYSTLFNAPTTKLSFSTNAWLDGTTIEIIEVL